MPADTRVYAIGDVHGRCDLLDQVLAQISEDARTAPPRKVLVLLGDLVDRGADSKGVVERAAQLRAGRLLEGFEVHVLKGNHEDMMLQFLAGTDPGGLWRGNGGDTTLLSYGLDPDEPTEPLRQDLLNALPESHRHLLWDMELSHIEGDYTFVHAGIRPGVAWENQRAQDLLWIREGFIDSDADFGRVVVHGHTPRPEPVVRPNRIGIDTRAWASGELTCLVIEGEVRHFIST